MKRSRSKKCKYCHRLPAVWDGFCISCWNEIQNHIKIEREVKQT